MDMAIHRQPELPDHQDIQAVPDLLMVVAEVTGEAAVAAITQVAAAEVIGVAEVAEVHVPAAADITEDNSM
jgi:hypothetical protein